MKIGIFGGFLGLALVFACVRGAVAQTAPGPTPTPDPCAGLLAELNRPSIGYSPCAAEAGTDVLELGYQHELLGPQSTLASQTQLGQGFLRFGVAQRLEVDFIGPNLDIQRGALGEASGLSDSGLGFKYELPPTQRWQIGIDGLYTTPSGATAFTTGNATYTTNLDASYQLTPATSLGATLSLASTGGFGRDGSHARFGAFTPSALVLEQIDGSTQAFVEYVNDSRVAPDAGDRGLLDAGLQHLVGARLEIDVEYGHALTEDAFVRFDYVGAGVGILLGGPP